PLMARFTDENVAIADEIIARYPRKRSALIPPLHLAQEQGGYVTEEAMEHIAELVGITPAEVLGTASLYEVLKRDPVGGARGTARPGIACPRPGGEQPLRHRGNRHATGAGATTPDGKFTREDVERFPACTEARCLQVTCRYFYRVSPERGD